MKFIDKSTISIKAGDGGNGCISFFKKPQSLKKYTNGGNGGNGGNIWLIADKNLNTLINYKFNKIIKGENGKNGKNNNCSGKSGKDIFIKIPLNTIVKDKYTNKKIINMTKHKQSIILAKGGFKGLGNSNFKLLMNKKQIKKTKGKKGETRKIYLELILLADVGIIGLPNSGKSTLINSISTSKSKINNYPFTTLTPNLGITRLNNRKTFTIADIPGLIKGASKGVGLGINFLKHIEHCKIIIHIIDISIISTKIIINNTKVILNELKNYNKNLINKTHWIIFNKIDKINKKNFLKKIKTLILKIKWNKPYYLISAKKKEGTKILCFDIIKFINN